MARDQEHSAVIVGGGAGGLTLASKLGRKLARKGRADIVLVDSSPTHLWKPLLHEVAAGTLDSHEDEIEYLAQAAWCHFRYRRGYTWTVSTGSDGRSLSPQCSTKKGRKSYRDAPCPIIRW
jgi:NADH dehydrogenase FAD-containing subunit